MTGNKLLVVVDVQNDFVDGVLGTPEAQAIIPNIADKIKHWDGAIISTFDTHDSDYLNTNESKHLPIPHCIKNTWGWQQNSEVAAILDAKRNEAKFPKTGVWFLDKATFGNKTLQVVSWKGYYDYIEFIGLCTDIGVMTKALYLKIEYPEYTIAVDPTCCAGTTPENHKAALTTMKMCQIEILGESNE